MSGHRVKNNTNYKGNHRHHKLKRGLTFGVLLCVLSILYSSSAFAIGLMIPKDSRVRPFDVESHRVNVTISNTAAVTSIEQVFKNHTDRPLEATFVFPIPEGATVSDFSLWINGKKTKGAVLEKKEARQIYESIVRRVEDPGLIEYLDGKLFKASIFPIPAGGTQKLEIKFGQVLEKKGGLYRYHYPLAVGQDYVTAKTEKDFTLTAKINGPIPITTVYSPSHKISTHRKSDTEVVLGTEEMYTTLDQDFELFLGLSKQDIGLNIMTHDPDGAGGEHGYFMMALAPRVEAAAHDEIGQTFTFVMDTSGSMAGDKMKQARETLEFCLKRLRPQDTFNVIRFSTDVEALFSNPVKATATHIDQGVAFSRALEPAGGTAIGPAMDRVFEQKVREDQPHQVIFVTDGIPTVGLTEPADILSSVKSRKGKARIFTFGVGYDVNTSLLDGMASMAQGRSDYVRPNEELESAVSALYSRISAPVLTDIKIDFGDARIYDMYPAPIPDLFRGDQVVLFGRFRKGFTSPITVTGRVGLEKKSYTFGESNGASSPKAKKTAPSAAYEAPLEFLPKLWATRKVGFLLEQIRLNGEQAELKDEVIRLSKKFGLVTPYTSYLAVDDSEFEQQPTTTSRGVGMRENNENIDDLFGSLDAPKEESSTRRPSSSGLAKKRKGKFFGSRGKSAGGMPQSAPSKADSFKDFEADTGEGSVAASEATRDYKEKSYVDDELQMTTRQWVAGRTFEWSGEYWVEDGLSLKSRKIKEVEAFSSTYFKLLKKHRDLAKVLQLGPKVLIKLDGKLYRFEPAKD